MCICDLPNESIKFLEKEFAEQVRRTEGSDRLEPSD